MQYKPIETNTTLVSFLCPIICCGEGFFVPQVFSLLCTFPHTHSNIFNDLLQEFTYITIMIIIPCIEMMIGFFLTGKFKNFVEQVAGNSQEELIVMNRPIIYHV